MDGKVKEPIRKKWIWVVLALILLGNVPWYWPKGIIEPIIFGFPSWAFVSVVFALLLCGFLSWLCLNQWNLVEEVEEEERKGEGELR
ncbi:hypothetical protein C8P63_11693 [Melghirimyces profundicolus]|uniref:DUF3311 domain-containing protein n=1 Tax=Melghirimyces profundicolus TaxID=1242148 RepID=A0A2T6BR27_9BACL|nr:hypothetical protein [Melghirimyces profundicolus]PTX58506.1 hypothetical protein C8P63_11693 [Melghirimyces profundicolus]